MAAITVASVSCVQPTTALSARSRVASLPSGLCGKRWTSNKACRPARLRARAADDDELDIEDLEARLGGAKGGKGGGTKNLNKAVSSAERRNLERREAAGAYFASPKDNPKDETPKTTGPFGLDIKPDEFKRPDNWDSMGGIAKLWTVWAGEGGLLPNINKFATGASVVMGLLWILFRFVGPTLGLYDLESGFNDTPNIGI
mmetsp:Transcript_4643/g.8800  ORF Transcript_4643/g.8800 Transcript_4643/m.8800 type:complete len:201 (-) Transcript_4643:300-902(-)